MGINLLNGSIYLGQILAKITNRDCGSGVVAIQLIIISAAAVERICAPDMVNISAFIHVTYLRVFYP